LIRTADGYVGGVLAPNGDIHFIPELPNGFGQKVSINGVVSTYNLAYTFTTPSYSLGIYVGGVLSPNGDVYFIPHFSAVGQKVSISGVVSTYSLAYTIDGGYQGGVLDFEGNIHLIPNSAVLGQKIYTLARPLDNEIALSSFLNKF
jgi:hypothetical protein